MSTTTIRSTSNGREAPEALRPPAARARLGGRRRQMPLVVIGVLLVIGGALAFADASLHLGSREEVLVISRPLGAGQVLTSSDLQSARVSTGSGLQVVPMSEEASVVGRPVALSLVAGSLLTRSEVGSPSPVASGSEVVALGLKAGQYPPDLAPGDRVHVVPVTAPSSSSGDVPSGTSSAPTSGTGVPSALTATVLAVDVASANSDSPTVFSLRVSSRDADEVATLAAAGNASLVQVGSGGR
jgi:hypothetical protein